MTHSPHGGLDRIEGMGLTLVDVDFSKTYARSMAGAPGSTGFTLQISLTKTHTISTK